jgi:hypothetical protein
METTLDLEEELPMSIYDGGTFFVQPLCPADPTGPAGYSVFSNLYLSAGSLLYVASDRESTRLLPKTRQIMSGPRSGKGYPAADEDRWRVVEHEQAGAELGKRAVYLRGVTVSAISALRDASNDAVYFQRWPRRR